MQKKMKLQQVLILFLAVIISLLLITLLAGRNDRVSIVVVASDKVDTNKKLNEQVQYFEVKQISKEALDVFGEGTVVTSIKDLDNNYLRFELPVGSPIPKTYLSEEKKSSGFAAELTKYHTVFTIPNGKTFLPGEIQPGDKIDIMLTLQPKEKEQGLITGPLLTNVTITAIGETDISVLVTQKDFNRLALAQDIGKFILQLPGQNDDSLHCDKVKADERKSVTCYNEDHKPSTITEFELRDLVEQNAALHNSEGSLNEEIDNLFETPIDNEETEEGGVAEELEE